MSVELNACPFCQCAMQVKSSYGAYRIDGEHVETCIFFGENGASSCRPSEEELNKMVERWNTRAPDPQVLSARGNVSNALNLVGQIRQGSNIPAQELWDACEYLDKAIAALPRPA